MMYILQRVDHLAPRGSLAPLPHARKVSPEGLERVLELQLVFFQRKIHLVGFDIKSLTSEIDDEPCSR